MGFGELLGSTVKMVYIANNCPIYLFVIGFVSKKYYVSSTERSTMDGR